MFKYLLTTLLALTAGAYAQQNVFHRDTAGTNNWWDGANPWFYQTWNNNQDRPDLTWRTGNNVFFGHNNNKTMNVNGNDWYFIRSLTLQAGANESRSFTNSGSAGLTLRGSGERKIENLSTAMHTFDIQIGIDEGVSQFNPVNGDLIFKKAFIF